MGTRDLEVRPFKGGRPVSSHAARTLVVTEGDEAQGDGAHRGLGAV